MDKKKVTDGCRMALVLICASIVFCIVGLIWSEGDVFFWKLLGSFATLLLALAVVSGINSER